MVQAVIDRLIIVNLANCINGNIAEIGLPCPVTIEDSEMAGEQLSLHAVTGGKIDRQYVGGSYTGNFPFAVRYQLSLSQAGRVGFAALDQPLWALSAWFEENPGKRRFTIPDSVITVNKIEMTGLPYALARGSLEQPPPLCVNQAVFKLSYSKKIN